MQIKEKQKSYNMEYRADIDGLRAVAVLLVLIYHAYPESFNGGFLGVDIFFVISGFLITKIILGNLENNSFTISDFLIRRVYRIFPALILILSFSLVVGWFGLTNFEFKELGREIYSASFFLSNISSWLKNGYFDNLAGPRPLLHLWSLAVEEQFYLIWPLIISFYWKKKTLIGKLTFKLASRSFIVYVILSYYSSNTAFYFPVSRFWEILTGAILASYAFSEQSFKNIKSGVGLALIFIVVFFISNEKNLFGLWTLFPVIGAALIISSGNKAWINHYILSNKVIVWIGLISYPLYLWHWPLFSFARIITTGALTDKTKLLLLTSSFLLAWLTRKYVEIPLRRYKNNKVKVSLLLGLLIFLGIIGFLVESTKGFPNRYKESENSVLNMRSIFSGADLIDCKSIGLEMKTFGFCTHLENPKVLLIGDSHAAQLHYGFKNSSDENFRKVFLLGAVKCSVVLDYYSNDDCSKLISKFFEILETHKTIEYVIVSGYHQVIERLEDQESEQYFQAYKKMLEAILKRGIKPVFIIDNLHLREPPLDCVKIDLPLRNAFSQFPKYCFTLGEESWLPHSSYDKFIKKLQVELPGVLFYNSRQVLCTEGKCSLLKREKLLYSDINHFSVYGSQLVAEDLIRTLKNFPF